MIAQGLWFSDAENFSKTRTWSSRTQAPDAGGVGLMQER